ncbi:MAG: HypC/HybG/HupF family hydrogenase formation chaperone [Thermomicrobiales bacterium]
MCIPMIARTIAINDGMAEIELLGGERVRANTVLHPDLLPEQYVLIDRGLVVDVIDREQAESMATFYTEIIDLWNEEDAASD